MSRLVIGNDTGKSAVISIDAGRSAHKIVTDDLLREIRIPSAHGIVKESLLKNSLREKDELIVSFPSIDNSLLLIGKGALDRLKSNDIIEVSETEEFLKLSYLYSIGALTQILPDTQNVTMLLQLTTSDYKRLKPVTVSKFSGSHMVKKYDSFGNPLFLNNYIVTPIVYVQGLTDFFDIYFDDEGTINEELESKTSLMVNVGHHTVDILLLKGTNISAMLSYPAGSGSVFYDIATDLRDSGIHITAKELEWRFIEQRYTLRGKTSDIDLKDMVEKRIKQLGQKVVTFIGQSLTSTALDNVFLTGGSSQLIEREFKDSWKFAELMKNPQFSSARGAMKYFKFGDKLKKK